MHKVHCHWILRAMIADLESEFPAVPWVLVVLVQSHTTVNHGHNDVHKNENGQKMPCFTLLGASTSPRWAP